MLAADETYRLVLGDCLGGEGLPSLPDASVGCTIADPPYEAEAHTLQRRVKRVGGGLAEDYSDHRVAAVESIGFDPITADVRLAVSREMVRVTRRWVVVFCQAEAVQAWREALEAAGAKYKRAAVWVKPDAQPQLTGDRPGMGYESIVCAHAPGRSRWNGGGRVGVYIHNKSSSDPERYGHPTQKPLGLMEALVRDFSDRGELVCDPFSGVATTGVACLRNGRRFLGWERSPEWCEAGRRRLAKAREQLGFTFGDAV
jgi:site-specific DNA-methyltransferase (adenine-specific)